MEILKIVETLERHATDSHGFVREDELSVAMAAAAALLIGQGEKIADLENELRDEMYRHDRLQDFEVAEAEELRKVRAKNQWIPVTERMPDLIPCAAGSAYSEAVLIWTTGRKAMVAVWDGIDFMCAADYWDAYGEEITHWKPLPELPKEVSGDGN